jgi:hypothetical protein
MVPDCPARKAHPSGSQLDDDDRREEGGRFQIRLAYVAGWPGTPNIDVWTQIIQDVQPKFVMTTGTSGGIGKEFEVGDVVVSPIVRFDCIKKFKKEPLHAAHYSSSKANTKNFAKAKALFKFNSGQPPPDNKRPPKIVTVSPNDLALSVVTTDFFGFDNEQ